MNPLSSPIPAPQGKPWGFWITAAFSCAILGAWTIAQVFVVAGFVVFAQVREPGLNVTDFLGSLERDGRLYSASIWFSSPVAAALTVLFSWLKREVPVREYLALRSFTAKAFLFWLAMNVVFLALSDGLTLLLDRPLVPPVMVDAYRSAGSLPLLVMALVIIAPAVEELFFRGFLFPGIAASRIGPMGAVVATSLLWAVVHFQYDFYGIGTIFFYGLLLGWVRWKTGSTLLCMLLHGINNMLATLEIEFFMV
jgi:uncharacterized protein